MAAGIPLVPSQPADPYAWAVQAAQRQYPRLTQYPPIRLTYNPQRQGSSETFPPTEEANPFPGNWTVEMGQSPYYRNRASWPGLVGLESLHMMQQVDPRYQQMTAALQQSVLQNEAQRRQLEAMYARDKLKYGVTEPFQTFLPHVAIPEVIRDRMFGPYFHQFERAPTGGWNEYHLTPEQAKMIDAIDQYMRSTGANQR